MAIEIVDLPIHSMMDLSSSLCKRPFTKGVKQNAHQSFRIILIGAQLWPGFPHELSVTTSYDMPSAE